MSAKILIVEDNADSCAYLSHLLEIKGYTVQTANDGLEALQEVERFSPDLIVSDIMMPRLDGIRLLKVLRHSPKYRDTPVVMVSAFGSGNLKEATRVGANQAMTKPLDFDQFFMTLEKLLKA